ncbi:uncharacterized protein LOC115775429 [Archocentrus centrarchus]|uniref:uncharacterized protein LOC115775429 n=1 Tax=Archocentrus centrarchus TaxID=63155 RepID=UPI0011E9F4FC|nr:uncharacterized protein LOC115775429 [Archocentrus centrarchus]
MFGRQPRLPVDLAFNLPVNESQHSSHSEYVRNLKSRLKESYQVAMDQAAKIAHKNKARYDRRVTASDLEAGDRVLVRNVRIRGKHKLSDKWETTVHVVVRRAGTLPVYMVKPENRDGPLRTLHRDLLLPCGYLPMEESSAPVQNPVPRKPGTRANPAVEEENSSDEGDDVLIPIYSGSPVPTVCESPVEPDLLLTNVQDTQRAEPPGLHPVESPETAQNAKRISDIDNLPDIDNPPDIDNLPDLDQNLPDMSNSTSDGPLILTESNSYQSDTECLPKSTEQAEKTAFTQEELPEVEYPSIQGEQPLVPAKITASTEENGSKSAESEEDGTVLMDEEKEKKETDMNDFVRRSERDRQPPKRLDYPELGNPLITAVKSFFQGLSKAWEDIEGDGKEPGPTPSLSPRVIII